MQDSMQMVWHYTKLKHSHFWVVVLVLKKHLNEPSANFTMFNIGLLRIVIGGY